ncbi:MAG: argininosuccinate lyase [bacterium]
MKLWGGRFTKETNKSADEFGASISFDRRLYKYDIRGSIAHAKMLGKCNIISPSEVSAIVKGLEEIERDIDEGKFEFSTELEDIHMNIESALIQKIGDVGRRLHTARSRNDQVALDIRLYLRDEIDSIIGLVKDLQRALIEHAESQIDVAMPGYTHLQHAQPVLYAHHLLAYCWMLERDIGRMRDARSRTNVMPLGAGALAGTTFPIDREYVAELLGFPEVTENSIDTVSDRDFIVEFLAGASIIMMHLSRLSEEIILWSSSEFGFVELDDAFATGSSIMPQKKNPDICELVRGKTGRVYGDLMALLTTMKALPLAYNKDMQEDKEPLFDAVDTLKDCLSIYAKLVRTMRVREDKMRESLSEGFITATDVADKLVLRGIPFREAHRIVGELVRYCVEAGKDFDDLKSEELSRISDLLSEDILGDVTISKSIEARRSRGGTARGEVLRQIEILKSGLKTL